MSVGYKCRDLQRDKMTDENVTKQKIRLRYNSATKTGGRTCRKECQMFSLTKHYPIKEQLKETVPLVSEQYLDPVLAEEETNHTSFK
jgi:hypothetical protein